MFLNKNNNI